LGNTLAAAGEDGALRLRDLATNQKVGIPLRGNNGTLNNLKRIAE
jgi:hypothetical protein